MRMQNKISFGKWEAVTLLINLICTKLFLNFSRMTVEDAGTAGWIMTIFVCLISLIIFAFLMKQYKNFDGKDILDVAEFAGGKPLMVLVGMILTGIFFYLTVIVIREFSEDMKVISLVSSPLSYVMFFFIIGVIIGSFFGIEAILRYHAIVVPIIAAGYILILLGAIPQMDITNITPILGTGLSDIFGKGLFRISIFGELLILFLLPPFLGSNKNVRTVGFITLGFSSFFFISGSLAYILTFPYPSNMEPFLPIYQMARVIQLGRFFQRIESVFVFIWAMAALLYLTSTFYFMVYTFSKASGLKYMRPLILPFAVIVFSAAFIPPNLIAVIQIETSFFNKIVWVASLTFIGVILMIANLRKRNKKRVL